VSQLREDYKDILNPYVRAEVEAFKRGYGEGLVSGIFYVIVALIAAGLVLVSWNAHAVSAASDWTYEESPRVIKASERGARLTVCQQNAIERGWACFIVK
jgi:hypothetical protein